ncbi:MAG: hypothetical protein D6797_06530 [Bdellovibrio sp.]|nr:MAG: hypothetical protein D6797_06530 [Bdellovibrio sp.]
MSHHEKGQELLESYLQGTLTRLEKSAQKIIQTSGYSSECEKMKILIEMIREQLKNENFSSSTRQVR